MFPQIINIEMIKISNNNQHQFYCDIISSLSHFKNFLIFFFYNILSGTILTFRYAKALDREAKILSKLAAKLGGDEENLNKRISMLTQALEVKLYS